MTHQKKHRLLVFFVFSATIFSLRASSCDPRLNTVRLRNDPYLKTTRYSLATEHELEGPGNAFTNYSKGVRKLQIEYAREVKDGAVIKEEMQLNFQLYESDADLDKRIFFFINGLSYEVPVGDVQFGSKSVAGSTTSTQQGYYTDSYGRGQSGPHQVTSSYSHAYKTAKITITPDAATQQLLKSATAFGIRAYTGVDAITTFFKASEVGALSRFYSNQFDKEVKD